jgi:2-amino-4-hydroxy-6-hydroxymethyldihydropteridine diphosphokinase
MTSDDAQAVVAYVGLGANLGDAASTLREAFARIDALPRTRLTACSRLYRTAAWGVRDQPDFVNAVAELRTGLSAHELLWALLAIERGFGRLRAADGSDRWGPRVLDLDVLLYGDARIDTDGLCVPHPQMHRRGFVLVPLREIAPDAMVPGLGLVHELADALAMDGEDRVEVLADA